MATVTFKTGVSDYGRDVHVNLRDAKQPYDKGITKLSGIKTVGTDFTSGDDLVFELANNPTVEIAVFTQPDGTIITYTEAALGTSGRKLTLSAVTTSVKYFIIASV